MFEEFKVYGPYASGGNAVGRLHVILIHKETKARLTKPYPRYLIEVKLGRLLREDETVDHIDNNFRNNSLDNLQILSLQDNIVKAVPFKPKAKVVELECSYCGKIFKRRQSDITTYEKHHNRVG